MVRALTRQPVAAVLATTVVLALPTFVAPEHPSAPATYLVGMGILVGAAWAGVWRLPGASRRGWVAFALAVTCWFVGDVVQRVQEAGGGAPDSAGLPDVFWLASYPLIAVAVGTMLQARGLGRRELRELRLDVALVTVAGSLLAWVSMIAPEIRGGTLTPAAAVAVLYPIGDVVLLAACLTLTMAPGQRSRAQSMVIACLAGTLVVDAAFVLLPRLAPASTTAGSTACSWCSTGCSPRRPCTAARPMWAPCRRPRPARASSTVGG